MDRRLEPVGVEQAPEGGANTSSPETPPGSSGGTTPWMVPDRGRPSVTARTVDPRLPVAVMSCVNSGDSRLPIQAPPHSGPPEDRSVVWFQLPPSSGSGYHLRGGTSDGETGHRGRRAGMALVVQRRRRLGGCGAVRGERPLDAPECGDP